MAEHSDHHHDAHHSHGHGHGEPRKYYENRDKYVYSEQEVEAYRISPKYRNVCVNLYIPYRECTRKLPILRSLLDPKLGNCSQETADYEHCMKIYGMQQNNVHVKDFYYANGAQAKADVLSPTLEQKYIKSPLSFTW